MDRTKRQKLLSLTLALLIIFQTVFGQLGNAFAASFSEVDPINGLKLEWSDPGQLPLSEEEVFGVKIQSDYQLNQLLLTLHQDITLDDWDLQQKGWKAEKLTQEQVDQLEGKTPSIFDLFESPFSFSQAESVVETTRSYKLTPTDIQSPNLESIIFKTNSASETISPLTNGDFITLKDLADNATASLRLETGMYTNEPKASETGITFEDANGKEVIPEDLTNNAGSYEENNPFIETEPAIIEDVAIPETEIQETIPPLLSWEIATQPKTKYLVGDVFSLEGIEIHGIDTNGNLVLLYGHDLLTDPTVTIEHRDTQLTRDITNIRITKQGLQDINIPITVQTQEENNTTDGEEISEPVVPEETENEIIPNIIEENLENTSVFDQLISEDNSVLAPEENNENVPEAQEVETTTEESTAGSVDPTAEELFQGAEGTTMEEEATLPPIEEIDLLEEEDPLEEIVAEEKQNIGPETNQANVAITAIDNIEAGNRIYGVEFTLYEATTRAPRAVGTTNAKGEVVFENLSPGDYYIAESKNAEGFNGIDAAFNVSVNGEREIFYTVTSKSDETMNLTPIQYLEMKFIDTNNPDLENYQGQTVEEDTQAKTTIKTTKLFAVGVSSEPTIEARNLDGVLEVANFSFQEVVLENTGIPQDMTEETTLADRVVPEEVVESPLNEEEILNTINSQNKITRNVPYGMTDEFLRQEGIEPHYETTLETMETRNVPTELDQPFVTVISTEEGAEPVQKPEEVRTFKIKGEIIATEEMNPGDTFTLQISTYLKPIEGTTPKNLQSETGKILATGEYNSETKTITYTFTEAIDGIQEPEAISLNETFVLDKTVALAGETYTIENKIAGQNIDPVDVTLETVEETTEEIVEELAQPMMMMSPRMLRSAPMYTRNATTPTATTNAYNTSTNPSATTVGTNYGVYSVDVKDFHYRQDLNSSETAANITSNMDISIRIPKDVKGGDTFTLSLPPDFTISSPLNGDEPIGRIYKKGDRTTSLIDVFYKTPDGVEPELLDLNHYLEFKVTDAGAKIINDSGFDYDGTFTLGGEVQTASKDGVWYTTPQGSPDRTKFYTTVSTGLFPVMNRWASPQPTNTSITKTFSFTSSYNGQAAILKDQSTLLYGNKNLEGSPPGTKYLPLYSLEGFNKHIDQFTYLTYYSDGVKYAKFGYTLNGGDRSKTYTTTFTDNTGGTMTSRLYKATNGDPNTGSFIGPYEEIFTNEDNIKVNGTLLNTKTFDGLVNKVVTSSTLTNPAPVVFVEQKVTIAPNNKNTLITAEMNTNPKITKYRADVDVYFEAEITPSPVANFVKVVKADKDGDGVKEEYAVASNPATFKLLDDKGNTIRENLKTDDKGLLTITVPKAGVNYILEETSVPTGFKNNLRSITFFVRETDNTLVYLDSSNNWVQTSEKGYAPVENELENPHNTLTINKEDQDGKPLPGAEFAIINKDTGITVYRTSGQDGKITLLAGEFPEGHYIIRETKAPNGYDKSTEEKEFWVANGGIYYTSNPNTTTASTSSFGGIIDKEENNSESVKKEEESSFGSFIKNLISSLKPSTAYAATGVDLPYEEKEKNYNKGISYPSQQGGEGAQTIRTHAPILIEAINPIFNQTFYVNPDGVAPTTSNSNTVFTIFGKELNSLGQPTSTPSATLLKDSKVKIYKLTSGTLPENPKDFNPTGGTYTVQDVTLSMPNVYVSSNDTYQINFGGAFNTSPYPTYIVVLDGKAENNNTKVYSSASAINTAGNVEPFPVIKFPNSGAAVSSSADRGWGSINLEKVSNLGVPISGADFKLINNITGEQTDFTPIETSVTDPGYVASTYNIKDGIRPGNYIILETNAPVDSGGPEYKLAENLEDRSWKLIVDDTDLDGLFEYVLSSTNGLAKNDGDDPRNIRIENIPSYRPLDLKLNLYTQDGSTPLSGGEFIIQKVGGNSEPFTVSGDNLHTVTLEEPGEYIIRQTGIPGDYTNAEGNWKVNVVTNNKTGNLEVDVRQPYNYLKEVIVGSVTSKDTLHVLNKKETTRPLELPPPYGEIPTATNEDISFDIVNKKNFKFTIEKTDTEDSANKLSGAEFKLTKGDNTIIKTATTDVFGRLTFDNLEPGNYLIEETKAPAGYKLNDQRSVITIGQDGSVTWTEGGLISSSPTQATRTETVTEYISPYSTSTEYKVGDTRWPSYMNTKSYANIRDPENDTVEFYLMLKPDANVEGGSTDRNTRLNLFGDNISFTADNVEMFDVAPAYRDIVSGYMDKKIGSQYTAGKIAFTNGVNQHNYPITKDSGISDPYLNRLVNTQIKIPKERFGGTAGWSFLVKVTGQVKDPNRASSINFAWLTDDNTAGQTNIQHNTRINPLLTTKEIEVPVLNYNPTLEVKNEKEPGKDFSFTKVDEKGQGLSGAKFKLSQENDSTFIREAESDLNGKVSFTAIPLGTYILEETKVPEGYAKVDGPWLVKVSLDTEGNPVTEYFKKEITETTQPGSETVTDETFTNVDNGLYKIPSAVNYGFYGAKVSTLIKDIDTTNNTFTQVIIVENRDSQDTKLNPLSLSIPNTSIDGNFTSYKVIRTAQSNPVTVDNYQNYSGTTVANGTLSGKSYSYTSGYSGPDTLIFEIKGKYDDSSAGYLNTNLVVNQQSTYSTGSTYYDIEQVKLNSSLYMTAKTVVTEPGSIETTENWVKIETPNFSVVNKKIEGKFELLKVDENGNPLSGANFKMVLIKQGDEIFTPIVKTSDTSGKVIFENLLPGVYRVEEASSPDGYIKTVDQWEVIIDDQGNVAWRNLVGAVSETNVITEVFTTDQLKVINTKEEMNKGTGTLEVKKLVSNNGVITETLLNGATFGLYSGKLEDLSETTQPVKTIITGSGTNNEGVAKFTDLAPGVYTLKEIEAPQGYSKGDTTWTVTVYETGYTTIRQNPTIADPTTTPEDVSDLLDVKNYSLTVDGKTGTKIMANKGEWLRETYILDPVQDADINAGDYFDVKFDKEAWPQGIMETYVPRDLIHQETGVILATAQYDQNTKTVRYTFTDSIEQFDINAVAINKSEVFGIDRKTVDGITETNKGTNGQVRQDSAQEDVTISNTIAGKTQTPKTFTVDYSIGLDSYGRYIWNVSYPDYSPLRATSLITNINHEAKTVTLTYYLNIDKANIGTNYRLDTSSRTSNVTLDSNSVKIYTASGTMPPSFDITNMSKTDVTNMSKTDVTNTFMSYGYITKQTDGDIRVQFNESYSTIALSNKTYIVQVTGTLNDPLDTINVYGVIEDYYGNRLMGFSNVRESGQGYSEAVGEANIAKISVPNEKAEMEFDIAKVRPNKDGTTFDPINTGELTLKIQAPTGSKIGENEEDFVEQSFILSNPADRTIKVPNTWPDGEYTITESKAPAGYIMTDNQYVINVDWTNNKITLVRVLDKDGTELTTMPYGLTKDMVLYPKQTNPSTSGTTNPLTIVNELAEYPLTGGMGTLLFTIIGLVTMGAGVIGKLKNREEEDSDDDDE
ncbi:Ig-like domain-containing protein [Peptoniphilus sp. KCTC 25270]|uniref:SpaA isopeptide-forming pilin-related protein n=1 Tax=Peptoniphilus sp. KCTC 25270 TaxID=2897414 RepID=UPI001E46B0D8|nr:SpaA isopeptide-forming pilin-related protein [Peptoniphilus sp. KCTC 25270]MCD1147750.1 Ig-like domain-containing protein [Peptoniphilus sp. KCTC 25270]